MESILSNPIVWGLLGSTITGFIAYQTASQKNNLDYSAQKELYVDEQLRGLLISYKSDLGELKQEIKDLIEKNQLLVEEVFNLKTKIIDMEGRANARNID